MFEFSVYDMTGRVRIIAADSGDRTHDYSDVNSMGYRSDELKQADLITIGCSQTFGIGVCLENTWGAVLSRELNMSHANLSFMGWSLITGITAAYAHAREHGAPKVIAILSPDFYRISWNSNSKIHTSSQDNSRDNKEKVEISDQHLTGIQGRDLPNYSKAPHLIQDIIPPEVSYYQNFWALNSFVEYCRLANIKLVVQTWEHRLESVLSAFDLLKEVYVPRDHDSTKSCTVDHPYGNMDHPHEISNGTDIYGRNSPHMGAHEHWHVATEMAEFLKKA
jgi:hypothetical protein